MAGIYIHIPICKSRCTYCDFYSTTHTDRIAQYISAVITEMAARGNEVAEEIHTIYIGGGTPSVVSIDLLQKLAEAWRSVFRIDPDAEITIEANPDDLNEDYLRGLRNIGFNRISLGIQSFNDSTLRLINRRHTGDKAEEAFHQARTAGFANISLDLIYGLPNETIADWQRTLNRAIALRPDHISAYCLTYEDNTPLTRMLNNGEIQEVAEEEVINSYNILCRELTQAGFTHYEISNFALPNRQSRHNSAYWQNKPYIGFGAAAHSYNGEKRRWNTASLTQYLAHPAAPPHEEETLSPTMLYNEYLLTHLRTSHGIAVSKCQPDALARCAHFIDNGLAIHENGRIRLTDTGMLRADELITLLALDE